MLVGSGESNKSSDSKTINESTNKKTNVVEEPKKKECYYCKGTGTITCTMCGGTGINNMGNTCGCVTYVENCIAMGKQPTRTALRWTCEMCKGTGYSNH